ncbi:hypothetical protein TNCV_2007221 [Trichonephila clavipes]|nr:hypothetical protein TNCV_2007221 [Trichonephila clavipes]
MVREWWTFDPGHSPTRKIPVCANAYGWLQKMISSSKPMINYRSDCRTATAGSDVVQSGRPIFDDFFQHLWPYIGNNTANVVFQMVKRLWLIRIDP